MKLWIMLVSLFIITLNQVQSSNNKSINKCMSKTYLENEKTLKATEDCKETDEKTKYACVFKSMDFLDEEGTVHVNKFKEFWDAYLLPEKKEEFIKVIEDCKEAEKEGTTPEEKADAFANCIGEKAHELCFDPNEEDSKQKQEPNPVQPDQQQDQVQPEQQPDKVQPQPDQVQPQQDQVQPQQQPDKVQPVPQPEQE